MASHLPVLLRETVELLAPKKGEKALDVTLGLGGHAEEILESIGESGHLTALDADTSNMDAAKERLSSYDHQITYVHANFGEMPQCLPESERTFDMILADLGLSSPHLDDPSRGFSFRQDGPLDMRFDQSKGMTAAMYLASTDERTLLETFRTLGEIPKAHRLTDAIVACRAESPVRTSDDLKHVADAVYGFEAKALLPQIFQALRMAVNSELASLLTLLESAPTLLAIGGRMAVISYHSLEDRMVKQAFRALTTAEKDPVTGAETKAAEFEPLTKKAIVPSDQEVKKNPRSRSAKLRAIRKRPVYTSSRS